MPFRINHHSQINIICIWYNTEGLKNSTTCLKWSWWRWWWYYEFIVYTLRLNWWCTGNCFPLLIQQHINGSDVFNRSWEEYKAGFNDTAGNFWVGNELLHQLTKNGRYKLRFDLRSSSVSNSWYWVEYGRFEILSEANKYLMHVGFYSGRWTDALLSHNGAMFSTYDSDNDRGGFWWNNYCHSTPLGSGGDFRWSVSPLTLSRMWLTCWSF